MQDSNANHTATTDGAPAANPPSLSDRVRSLRLPDRARSGGFGSGWIPWALCIVLTAAVAYLGYAKVQDERALKELAEGKQAAPATPANPGAAASKSFAPSASSASGAKGEIAHESKGYIIPISMIQVSPKVGGMVMKLYITEGMYVAKDAVLAEIEEIEYKAEFDRVAAAAESAKFKWHELWKYREDETRQARAELDDTRAQRDQLFQEWKRSISLRTANALAAKELEEAESSYKSMQFRVDRLQLALNLLQKGPRDERIAAAKADRDQADADVVKAKWKLDNCKVRAPIAGIILTKKAEEGNQVNPSAFSNGLSASLCEMADLTKMEVDLAIAERDVAKVFQGQKCNVRPEAFPERIYEGEVSRLMPTADRAKGAVPVRVRITIPREEEGRYLRPEMGAVVTFLNKK